MTVCEIIENPIKESRLIEECKSILSGPESASNGSEKSQTSNSEFEKKKKKKTLQNLFFLAKYLLSS